MNAALVVASVVASAASLCAFPKEWRGNWYESRLGDITIMSTNITKKGTCVENYKDFYLLEDIEIGCHLCLLIQRRHYNVLQYKESFCVGRESLQEICSTIQHESMQHTLIKESSHAASSSSTSFTSSSSSSSFCPFHDAFHFSYSNSSGGICRSPMSYAKPCASPSQLMLHFSSCPDAAYTYERDIELECLSSWRDGAEMFSFVRILSRDLTTKNDRYRCLMYKVLGTVVYIAMSADASCRGLISPVDGPVVMEFTQDVFGWPTPQCSYPKWIARKVWRDLSGRHLYETLDADATTIRLSFRQLMTSHPEVMKSFRCYRVLENNCTSDQHVAISFVSHGCTSKYQCIKLLRRKEDGVVEIHEGRYMEYPTEPCLESDMLESNRRLLIPDDQQSKRCPFEGRHIIHTGTTVCDSYFRLGCNVSEMIDIVSSCSSKPGLQLECLQTWMEGTNRYLVARLHGDQSGIVNCFSFRPKGSFLIFSVDASCNVGTSNILRDRDSYVMDRQLLNCLSLTVQDDAGVMSHGGATLAPGAKGAPYRQLNDESTPSGERETNYHLSFSGVNIIYLQTDDIIMGLEFITSLTVLLFTRTILYI